MESEKLTPAKEFIDDIEKSEDVVILHHWDMDGISSAVIISKVLEKNRGKQADTVKIPDERAYHLEDSDLERAAEADRLIVLDFNLEADELEQIDENGTDVLVVDHHSFDRVPDVNFVNPREDNADAYIPCSKICLDISELYSIDDDVRWIAGMGIIQDFGVEQCLQVFKDLEEEYEQYLPKDLTQEELAKNCEYGRYASVLNIKPYRDSQHFAKLAYKALMKSESLLEIEAQEEYRQVYEVYLEMQEEFNDVMENYEEEREIDRDKMIIFFELESDFHITSSISTNMSTKTPDWIHLVIQKDDEANISARCQSGRVDLGKLMHDALPEEAIEEGAEAGGHAKAAGASMKVEYLDEFKKKFTNLIE